MPVHQFEARCMCGARWRVYLEADDDAEPMATCVNWGTGTFNLTDIGEERSAEPGTVRGFAD